MFAIYGYRFIFKLAPLILFFYLALINNKTIAATEEYIPSDYTQTGLDNDSLQKMFIRVEILQRRNQELQSRIENLENQNNALSTRLKELSVEFDGRIEFLSGEYRDFKNEVNRSIDKNKNASSSFNQQDSMVDLKTQEIYRQGIVSISLEQYDKAIERLNVFLEQVNPNAENLVLKAKYWIGISLSKIQKYGESFPLFFELEQDLLSSENSNDDLIDINQVRIEMIKSLVGSKKYSEAEQLINKYLSLQNSVLDSLIEPIQSELKLAHSSSKISTE